MPPLAGKSPAPLGQEASIWGADRKETALGTRTPGGAAPGERQRGPPPPPRLQESACLQGCSGETRILKYALLCPLLQIGILLDGRL